VTSSGSTIAHLGIPVALALRIPWPSEPLQHRQVAPLGGIELNGHGNINGQVFPEVHYALISSIISKQNYEQNDVIKRGEENSGS
jgi:hypothetical protein